MAQRTKKKHVTSRPTPFIPEFDPVLHQRVRLGIVSALAAGSTMSFGDLKTVLELTDGNLSVHARKLEEAGFVTCRKYFENRTPHTDYSLTFAGRAALDTYLNQMEAVIEASRNS
jgi:DNA-binding HxlR family transcriptional regulator